MLHIIVTNITKGERGMSEEKRILIVETVKNLRQMDKESLLIIKSGSELLRARDALDSKMSAEPITG